MRRFCAVLGSALFLVLAPGTLAVLIPWWISGWRFAAPVNGWSALRVSGVLLIAAAAPLLLDSFARFAMKGLGTPAPVFPTRNLVISGLYRYVRNPIYIAVVASITGRGLLFGQVRLLEYAALVWLLFHLFVVAYEEPTLRATFGPEYEDFRAAVPRWIPRLSAWQGRNSAG